MAIDGKQMQAFAKGGPPPNKGEHSEEGEPDAAEHEEDGGEANYDHLKQLLEQHGQDVEACVEELDPEQLANFAEELSDADKQILREGFDALEQGLTDEAKSVLPGIDEKHAEEIGQHLESEGVVQDGHSVGAWLFRVGQMLESGDSDEESDDDEESDADDSEGDDAGGDDAGANDAEGDD